MYIMAARIISAVKARERDPALLWEVALLALQRNSAPGL